MESATVAGPVAHGVAAYAGVLRSAGGRELEALQRGDGSSALAAAIYASPAYDVEVPALAVARLSINLSPARVSGQVDGERRRSFEARRFSLFVTPAGAAARWRKEQPSRHINLYFDAKAFAVAPLMNTQLPGAGTLFEMLAAELAGHDSFADEAVDSLARLILLRLARRRLRPVAAANPLTPALLARLRDFVVAHLEQRLLVADLAAVAGLAPNRFAQAFVAGSGQSPHQFVLTQRLEQAVQQLRLSRQPLADVAAACGFASQQHMTQLMRRRLGTTPARCRADQASSAAPRPCTSRYSQVLNTM